MSLRSKRVSRPGRQRPAVSGVMFRAGSAACLVVCTAAALASPTAASAAVANRASSAAFPGHIVVTNLHNAGPGSLRNAIMVANGSPVASSFIDFAVSGTISLNSPLPAISRKVTIDARFGPGSGPKPLIEINFNRNTGLRFAPGSAGSQLLGVAIDNATGNGVTLEANWITLDRDFIGLSRRGVPFGQHRRRGVRVGVLVRRHHRPERLRRVRGRRQRDLRQRPERHHAGRVVAQHRGGQPHRDGPDGRWRDRQRAATASRSSAGHPQRDRRHRVRRPRHRPGEQPDRQTRARRPRSSWCPRSATRSPATATTAC